MKIRTWYGLWREVDWKQARKLIKHLLAGMTNIRAEQKAAYVEARHLRGPLLLKF